MPRVNLTERSIAKLAAPDSSGKQVIHWDTSLRGFGVLCSGTSTLKTFVVQREASALADRQVACLALPALAFAGYGVPKISISKQTVVVMQDASPAHISAVGTPATVAAPTFNTFQADGVALKVVMDLDWVLRDSAGFAWTQSTNW